MDAEYLKQNIGGALAQALAASTIARPEDPIEFVALWLIKHVNNAKRQGELIDEGISLEEQSKAHLQNIEYERLRVEEDKRAAEEKSRLKSQEVEDKRMQRIEEFENGKKSIEEEIHEKMNPPVPEKGKKKVMHVDPLLAVKSRLSYITSTISYLPKTAFEEICTEKEPESPQSLLVIRGVLFLLGYRKREFYKWRRAKRILRKTTIQQSIVEIAPTHRQTLRKFLLAASIYKKISLETFLQEKPSYIIYLLHQWLQAVVQLRSQALDYRNFKLGLTRKEQLLDPEQDDDDVEDEEEQEELEIPLEEVEESEPEEVEQSEDNKENSAEVDEEGADNDGSSEDDNDDQE